ncbi:unnamed protein product [Linum trigynum]|uniref:DUF4005 domain-containing protein n=1 Tax=Linum trigynum TaxID=586398 RepID=A0AAV2CGX0_9ROSI
MGRSNSCFKIITCGSDSAADKDDIDIQAPENKGSSDKRGWSFRKRSDRHRVLSNNVTSEPPSTANKESIEPASLSYRQQDAPSVPEKISVAECIDEKPALPVPVEEKTSKTITLDQDEKEADTHVEDSVVIILQSAVRAFMAKKEFVRLKSVVKLQAVVRGHLVRQRAVGTLRCVQAITKMQVLVRARHARNRESNIDNGKAGKIASSKSSKKELSISKPTITYTSLEKLLSNRFARQLIGSTPKSRPINIKCDPLRPNSSWVWLERWMSASSVEPTPKSEPTPKPKSFPEKVEEEKQEEHAVVSESSLVVEDSRSHIEEAVSSFENEENLIAYDANDPKLEACQASTHPAGDNSEQPQGSVDITYDDVKEASIDSSSRQSQTLQSDVQVQPTQEFEQPEPPKRSSMKRLASDELETEGNKFVYGSRKVSNPAFVAAQSKFEHGLGPATDSNKRHSRVLQDAGHELKPEKASSEEILSVTKEPRTAEHSATHLSTVQYGDSECGTELSVTSTLDSPDISEVGAAELEHRQEGKTSVEETHSSSVIKNAGEEFKDASEDPLPSPSNPVVTQSEELDGVKSEAIINSVHSPEVEVEREQEEAERLPEAASPTKSQITIQGEAQGTPASQVSVTKSEKRDRRASSTQKRKSLSAGNKKSAPSPQSESNSGKRRSSFGSPRRDDTTTTNDQEPRPSNSSSSSVPRFMQVTESARAKLQANNSSPRSSPDVNDREYIKKRHSLPGANGRHGSPRIQRTSSQSQPAAKNEKKWQR